MKYIDYPQLLTLDNFTTIIDKLNNERNILYEEVTSFSLSSDDGDIEGHAASIKNK